MGRDPTVDRLRTMQRVALALLVAAAALFVLARAYEPAFAALGYVRAFCEAALVGGLADWFAVSALFRRPLGLPIPHTAIIPEKKDRLGEALGEFVERNFLSTDAVTAKLGDIDFSDLLANWLADPARSGPIASRLAAFAPHVLDAMGDEPMRHFIRENVAEGLRRIEMAPLAAEVLETLTAHNRHQELVDEMLKQAERFLREAEPEIRGRVRAKTAWLWQKLGVDERIADRLIQAAEEALAEVSNDPAHAWRQRFTQVTHEYVDALRHSEEYRRRAEHLKHVLLSHSVLRNYLGAVWDAVRAQAREDAGRPDSRIRANLHAAVVHLGEALLSDPPVRAAINGWVRSALSELVRTRRNEVASLISDTVRRWDARTVSDKIERAIGRDLQYIRINGTLIGGLVGLLLHAASRLLPW